MLTVLCCVMLWPYYCCNNTCCLQVRSSQRPPTASLQHCVHLHTAQAGSSGGGSSMSTSSIMGGSLGGSSACSTNTSLGGAGVTPWSPLGGPGCPSAGTPTRKGEWDPQSPTAAAAAVQHVTYEQQQLQQQQQQVQAPVFYGRGTGIKALLQGSPPKDPYSHGGYQQALMAAAANPAPPRSKAGPLPPAGSIQQPTWQQHQQQQQRQYATLGGNSSGGGGRGYDTCRDSLDKLVSGVTSSNSIYGTTYAGAGSTTAAGAGGRVGDVSCRQGYAVTAPFGSWEPRPGSLLPQDSADSERVSLKRQAAQLTQQRLQQQKPAWVVAGAGPPGHLLAAPLASYAVPTADMADVIGSGAGKARGGGCQELPQQRGGEGQWGLAGTGSGSIGRQASRRPVDSLCLSWDGLPQGLAAGGQLGRNDSGSMRQGGDRLLYGATSAPVPAKSLIFIREAAAQMHRSGSGAEI